MRRHTRLLVVPLVVSALVLAACGGDEDVVATAGGSHTGAAETSAVEGTVTVFAAASLTAAFEDLGAAFAEANPDADVVFNFAASSELVTQIGEGAPADLFASADLNSMSKLTDAGDHATDPVIFTTNRLEIIVAPGNPLGITGVADLANQDLIVVNCAPEVPCGRYANDVFAASGAVVTPKSLEENVKGVVAKVMLGEADAGIVYRTDVIAAGADAAGVEIPVDVNVFAEYPIAVTAEAPNPEGAQAFIDVVLSAEGQAILESYGFVGP